MVEDLRSESAAPNCSTYLGYILHRFVKRQTVPGRGKRLSVKTEPNRPDLLVCTVIAPLEKRYDGAKAPEYHPCFRAIEWH
jgi:hypothetical protein